jgi:hypothetical protein
VTQAVKDERDLIDRIADALPVEVRADFLRELRHCRSLPENDEMLRILRAMQFLTLLMHSAPSRLAEERRALDDSLGACATALAGTLSRLDALPGDVASGISPEAIASKINESLRQQFLQSTIPQTGDALALVAAQMKKAVVEFEKASQVVSAVHRNAASETNQAVQRIESSVRSAAYVAERATKELTSTFIHEYRYSMAMIAMIALVAGILFGVAFMNWRRSPIEEAPPPPVPEVRVTKPKR